MKGVCLFVGSFYLSPLVSFNSSQIVTCHTVNSELSVAGSGVAAM